MSANEPNQSSPRGKHKNDNIPRSVVIPEPPKVGYTGIPKPQLSMDVVVERFAPNPSSVLEGTASSSSRTASTSKAVSRTLAYNPQ